MSCVVAKNFRSVKTSVGGTVWMCLLALLCQLPAFGVQSVTLSWNASSNPTVAGYKIYYGTASGVYSGFRGRGQYDQP